MLARSPRRASLIALLVAALVLALPAGTGFSAPGDGSGLAPPGMGPRDWTVETTAFDTLMGPDGDIPVTLDARLYTPDGASPEDPVPVVMQMPGFGVAMEAGEIVSVASYFASHGYLVVVLEHPGFGASTGCIALDGRDYENRGARQVIDWIAEQPYVALNGPGDPRIGFIGGSYGGGWQGHTAIDDGRVDAIAPGRTWNDLAYSLNTNDHVPDPSDPFAVDTGSQGVYKIGWSSLLFASGNSNWPQGRGGCDPVSRRLVYPTASPCPGWIPPVCETQARLIGTGNATQADIDLVAGVSLNTTLDDLTTPTLWSQGLPDTLFTVNETVDPLHSLQSRGIPAAIFWHSSGHGGWMPAPGDGEAYGGGFDGSPEQLERFANAYFARRHLNWMERFVRGRTEVDTGPAFAYFRDWVEYDTTTGDPSSVDAYGTAGTYPPEGAEELVFTLDPSTGSLVPAGSAVSGGSASFLNPAGGAPTAYSELPNFSSPGGDGDRPAEDIQGLHLAFESPPFEAPVDWVGIPFLEAHLAHDNPAIDLRVFLKVFDVAPDGTATLVRRQVAPSRVPSAALDEPVTLRGVGNVWRFGAGHAVRLVLASTDAARHNEKLPDRITLTSTADAPSTFRLPVVPAPVPTSPAPAPPPEEPAPPLPTTGGGLAVLGLGALVAATGVRPATPRRRDR